MYSNIFHKKQDLTKTYSLSTYVNNIKNLIKQNVSPVWLVAEVSEFKPYGSNLFLTLVEYDDSGNLLARARAIIWNFAEVLKKFSANTDIELKIGIKILALITADYHLQYGLTLIISNLDPSYTLGDAQAKVIKIKQQLIQEGIFDNNKNLAIPLDFKRIAVISPNKAAGLGDFSKDALILQNYELCHFDYYTALFQGSDTSRSITAEFIKILNESAFDKKYDAIVIIRGGGASSDLTWLNDYAIAKAICLASIPVFSGIGHQKDQTIIDQVCKISFDTPSKVINFLITRIAAHAEQLNKNITYIKQYFQNFYNQHMKDVLNMFEHVKINSIHKMQKIEQNLEEKLNLQVILQQKLNSLEQLLDITWQQILCFSPEKTLKRGFAIVYSDDGNKIPIGSKVIADNYNQLIIRFHDGEVKSEKP